jgi:inorganic pyrophosphatase
LATARGVILEARVVGGLPMMDSGEADDKIIAVLTHDAIWNEVADIGDLPPLLVERLRHYFLSYKTLPGEPPRVTVGAPYDRAHALTVIAAASADYAERFAPAQDPVIDS